jgi:hypothetical protein
MRWSRAWLAVRQSESVTALVRRAWAYSCALGVIRCGPAILLAPSIDSSGAAAGSWLMPLNHLHGAEGGPQPAEGRELVIVDLRHVAMIPGLA